MRINILIIVGILMFSTTILFGNISEINQNNLINEREINIKHVLTIGSDKENEDFYDPYSFAIDNENKIYILDTKNSRIQCFMPDGNFIRSFGRYGNGPGELSKTALVIKILEDNNVYIYDYLFRNVNIYTRDGKYLDTFKITTKCIYNDIEMFEDKYYLSNVYLVKNNNPIHIYNKKGEFIKGIGEIIEPEIGLIKEIEKSPNVGNEDFFGRAHFSSIRVVANGDILYSLMTPYKICIYGSEGKIKKEINGEIEYGNKARFYLQDNEGIKLLRANFPLPIIFPPIIMRDESIIIPLSDKDRKWLYLDKYDKWYKYQIRYKIPMQKITSEKNEAIRKISIDKNNIMYCLIYSSIDNSKLKKYEIQY